MRNEPKITNELLQKHDASKSCIIWFSEHYPNGATLDDIKREDVHPPFDYVYWLMTIPEFRNEDWWNYYMSLKPDANSVAWILVKYPEFRTEDKWNYFMSLKPYVDDVEGIFINCPEFHTEEKWNNFISLNPTEDDVKWVLKYYPELAKFNKKMEKKMIDIDRIRREIFTRPIEGYHISFENGDSIECNCVKTNPKFITKLLEMKNTGIECDKIEMWFNKDRRLVKYENNSFELYLCRHIIKWWDYNPYETIDEINNFIQQIYDKMIEAITQPIDRRRKTIMETTETTQLIDRTQMLEIEDIPVEIITALENSEYEIPEELISIRNAEIDLELHLNEPTNRKLAIYIPLSMTCKSDNVFDCNYAVVAYLDSVKFVIPNDSVIAKNLVYKLKPIISKITTKNYKPLRG